MRGFAVRGQRRDAAFRNATELAGRTEIHALPEGLVGEGGFRRMAPGALSADDTLGFRPRRGGHIPRQPSKRSNRNLYKKEHSSALRYEDQRACVGGSVSGCGRVVLTRLTRRVTRASTVHSFGVGNTPTRPTTSYGSVVVNLRRCAESATIASVSIGIPFILSCAAVVVVLAVLLVGRKRPPRLYELGPISDQWLSKQRAHSRDSER